MKPKPVLYNAHLEGDTFFWPNGPVGVLLSHGYTATTAEVRLLARRLYEQGYTVAGPLLPGHGDTPAAMNRCCWQDWVAAMEEMYRRLSGHCRHIFVGGESMGAMVALYLAGDHPEVAGILTYAPAMQVSRFITLRAQLIAPFMPVVPKRRNLKWNEHWKGYTVNPVRGFLQMIQLQRTVRSRLPAIHVPLLLIQGRLDTTIDLQGAGIVYREIGSAVKELHWLEHTGHLVLLEQELEQVVALTVNFMEKCLTPVQN
jgi:carboxylesterase